MRFKNIIETLRSKYSIDYLNLIEDTEIERCQLIFTLPEVITPKTIYIQGVFFPIDPTMYPQSRFLVFEHKQPSANAVCFHSGKPLELYQEISLLLVDSEVYNRAIVDFQNVSLFQLGIEEMLKTAYSYLNNPIHIVDKVFSLAYSYPNEPCGDETFDYFLEQKNPLPEYLNHVEAIIKRFHIHQIFFAQIIDYDYQRAKLITCPIGSSPHLLGGIEVLQKNRPFSQTDAKIVDALAFFLACELYKDGSRLEKTDSAAEQFIQDILCSNAYNRELLKMKLASFPQLSEHRFRVLFSRIPEEKSFTLRYYEQEIREIVPVVEKFRYQNDLYFLFHDEDFCENMAPRLDHLAGQSNTLMILGDPICSIFDLSDAVSSLQIGQRLTNGTIGLFRYKDLYFKTLIHSLSFNMIPLSGFIHPGIERLDQFDKKHQTDFLYTFKIFLQCQCSPSNTAQTLHLHRNSLMYRVQKARQISSFMSEDPIDCQNFLLSIQIYEYEKMKRNDELNSGF